jgi:mono/diheme cytochrome c family protein
MSDLLLLTAFVAFVVSAAFFMKSRTHTRKLFSVLFIAASAVTLISCGDGDDPEGKDTDTLLSTDKYTIYITKEDIDSIEDAEPDSTRITMSHREYEGMQLFMTHCNRCHPGGNKGEGPSLVDKPLPDFLVHFQIRQGMGDMPAFKEEELSKDQVQKIVLFVRSLRDNYKATH